MDCCCCKIATANVLLLLYFCFDRISFWTCSSYLALVSVAQKRTHKFIWKYNTMCFTHFALYSLFVLYDLFGAKKTKEKKVNSFIDIHLSLMCEFFLIWREYKCFEYHMHACVYVVRVLAYVPNQKNICVSLKWNLK